MKAAVIACLLACHAASAATVARTPHQMAQELERHRCSDTLPFPLPSAAVSAEWGDADFERWEVAVWSRYCQRRAQSHACRCAVLRGGGNY